MTSTALARPPFDREVGAALAAFNDQIPVLSRETLQLIRTAPMPGEWTNELLEASGLVRKDVSLPGYKGATIEATAISRAGHTGTGPGIYHVHGGAMVSGHRMAGTTHILDWVAEHDAVLVTVEYRLAPEFPDPYPVEDAYAGLVWTADHAAELGIDPNRIIVAGTSAGGGLAAGVTLLARDRGGPQPAGQMLICPMLDDRDRTTSTLQYEDEGLHVRSSNVTGWDCLLGERRGTDDVSIYAAPARATDLSGLPPTFIDCGDAEVFRDEDVAYASALWAAGVPTELHVWTGGFHGFDMLAPHAAVSQAAIAARNSWIARRLEQS